MSRFPFFLFWRVESLECVTQLAAAAAAHTVTPNKSAVDPSVHSSPTRSSPPGHHQILSTSASGTRKPSHPTISHTQPEKNHPSRHRRRRKKNQLEIPLFPRPSSSTLCDLLSIVPPPPVIPSQRIGLQVPGQPLVVVGTPKLRWLGRDATRVTLCGCGGGWGGTPPSSIVLSDDARCAHFFVSASGI